MSDTVEIIIRAKDEASRTIGGVERALGGLGGAARTIGTVGAGAILGVGAAAVAGFGMAIKEGIGMNASLEQSTMMFTTLMGDAELAEKHVASLFDFAAATPFETGEIIQASKHFQVFGGDALNTLENLTLVGDAAAAVGAPFDEVAFWTGRMYSAIQGGQPFGEAAMRLQELGLMTPEVRAAMEDMQKSGVDSSEIWSTFAGDMGRFTGAMEMQSQSWVGLTSTIKDNISMLMADALRPFFDLAKEGLAGLAAWLSSPEVQAGIQNFATGLKTLIENIATFVTTYVIPFVQTHGPQLQGVMIALSAVILATVIPAIVGMIISLAPILLVFAAIVAAGWLLATAWSENWGGIQEKTAAVVAFIQGIIQAGLAFIQGLWDAHGATIMGIVNTVMTTIQTIIGAALAGIQAFWQEHGAAIMEVVSAAWEFIKVFIQTAMALIIGTAQAGLEAVRAFWESHGAAIMEAARIAWEFIDRIVEGALEHMKLVFDAWRALFQGDFEMFKQKLVEIWRNLWDTVTDILRGLWALISPVLANFWQSITGWFTQKKAEMIAFGSNLIQGLIDGINAVGMNILNVLGDWVQKAIDYAKSLLGISSPSRVFYEFGRNIGEGLIAGVEDIGGDVLATVEGLMKGISAVGGIMGGFENVFKDRILTPIENQVKALKGQLTGNADSLKGMLGELGLGDDLNDPMLFERLKAIATGATGAGFNEMTQAQNALALLEQRQDLIRQEQRMQEQLISQQQRLMLLEQQRADIAFLQQQFELLKLIRDNNLGADILQGVELGLGADPGALMRAMSEALQMLLGQTASTLQGATPAPASRSLADGFFNRAAAGDSGSVTINIDARQAAPGVEKDIRRVVEDVMREQGLRADIRMRTGNV